MLEGVRRKQERRGGIETLTCMEAAHGGLYKQERRGGIETTGPGLDRLAEGQSRNAVVALKLGAIEEKRSELLRKQERRGGIETSLLRTGKERL